MSCPEPVELGYETLPHAAYSSYLSSTDYHLFKHLDPNMKDKEFSNQYDVENDLCFINSHSSDFYKDGISRLLSRFKKCVNCNSCNGAYVD